MAGPIDTIIQASVDGVKRAGVAQAGALMANVSAVGTDGTVTVTRGTDTYPLVRILSGYINPVVGDAVEILHTAGGWVCLGALLTYNPGTWKPLTLNSGWTTFSGYATPAYRLSSDGMCYLRGLAQKAAGAASGASVCTLPAEARPATKRRFVAQVSGTLFGSLTISADGTVVIGDFTGTASWATLDPAIYSLT